MIIIHITNLIWLGYMQWYIKQKFNFFFLTCCKPQHFVSTSTCKPSEDSKVSFILISINWSNLSFRLHFQLVFTSVSNHFITAVCGSEIISSPNIFSLNFLYMIIVTSAFQIMIYWFFHLSLCFYHSFLIFYTCKFDTCMSSTQ